jgi:ABC-type multidrug transport system permease subunit
MRYYAAVIPDISAPRGSLVLVVPCLLCSVMAVAVIVVPAAVLVIVVPAAVLAIVMPFLYYPLVIMPLSWCSGGGSLHRLARRCARCCCCRYR